MCGKRSPGACRDAAAFPLWNGVYRLELARTSPDRGQNIENLVTMSLEELRGKPDNIGATEGRSPAIPGLQERKGGQRAASATP